MSFNSPVIECNNENYKGGSLFFQSHYHVTIADRLVRVYPHMCWKFPHNRDSLIQSSCFMSWCHNRARKYSVPFLRHLAVRTSQRYDLTSWSGRPLWWNAVIKDICEAKGSWTLPTSFTYALCVRACVWLLRSVERCQRVGFLNPIVPFHCVGVFVWGEQPPMTFSQKEVLLFHS